MVEPYRPQMTI